jgi:hypothetical protein
VKLRWSCGLVAVALAVWSFSPHAADAAVICQKGSRVKFRADACKPGWTQLAAVGGGAGDPSGSWEFSSGTLFDSFGLVPRFLVLAPDGSGRVNFAGGEGGVLTCLSLNYARSETPTLTVEIESAFGSSTRVLRYALDGDHLDLFGPERRSAGLTRADAVPADVDCASLTEVTLFSDLPIPDSNSGLAYDGTQLWYQLDNVGKIVAVDPGTGAAGEPEDFGARQFEHIHAASGADFWAHCNCGSNEEAGLVTRDEVVADTVNTLDELADEISLNAIAFDAASGTLWLHGRADDGGGRLLKIDPSGEPDVLLAAFDLDADLTGLAFDGASLWAVDRSGQSLVRIDPATGVATGTFEIPNHFAFWQGVAVVGTELAVLGSTGLEGAILKVALPPL